MNNADRLIQVEWTIRPGSRLVGRQEDALDKEDYRAND
jgi:hypothetical protein